jgi:hypothetical protein
MSIYKRPNAPSPKIISDTARVLGDIDNDPEDAPGTGRKFDESAFCSAADCYLFIRPIRELKSDMSAYLECH